MKGFTKLALVSAIAALPMTGFAMEALDDATMSDVTGQDGIVLTLGLAQTLDILVDDTNGLSNSAIAVAGYTANGGILISQMAINGTATIEVDAGGNGTDGVLAVEVSLANGFAIQTGDLYAVDTTAGGGDYSSGNGANTLPTTAILDSMTVTFASGLDLEIQLGDGADEFMRLSGDAGTININNFALRDVAGGGSLSSTLVSISGLDLTGTTVSLTGAALVVDLTTSGLDTVGVSMSQLTLGGGSAIGDVYISGLDMTGTTLSIAGKP